MAIEDNPESRTSYGDELRRRREAAGLTQEELSVRAIMSRTHIAHIEAGRRRPSLEDARRLDQVLTTGGVFENFLPTQGEGRVAEHFAEALELERQATAIREYAPKLVPGSSRPRRTPAKSSNPASRRRRMRNVTGSLSHAWTGLTSWTTSPRRWPGISSTKRSCGAQWAARR